MNAENNLMALTVNSVPAVLQVNFTELKTHLQAELTKYDIVVTIDTVKNAKKLSTELNKIAGNIDTRRREEVSKVSEPIRQFDREMKELTAMCREGRKNLLSQVKKFEDDTREKVNKLLLYTRAKLIEEYDVLDEFVSAEFADLILISNITTNGKLTKSTIDTLTMRVRDDRAMQDMVDMRLVKLENSSYKAGLSSPLTKDHILPFIKYDDESYEKELNRILRAEVIRQEESEKVIRRKLEREKQQKEQAEREKKEADDSLKKGREEFWGNNGSDDREVLKESEKEPEINEPQVVVTSEGKEVEIEKPAPQLKNDLTVFQITAFFEITAPTNVTDNAIIEKLNGLLEKAGITTLTRIDVVRQCLT